MDFVSWDDDQQIPNCFWKVIIHSWFQSPPTSKKKSWIQRTQAETDLKILSFIKVFYCFFNGFLWFFMVFYALETSWTLPERWILRLSPSHLHDVTGHLCRGMIGTAQPMLGHPMVGDVPGRHPPDLWTSPRCWRPNALQGCNSGDFHQSHGVSENIPDNMGSAMICWFELIRKCPTSTSLQPFSTNTTSTWVKVRTDPPVIKHGNWTFTIYRWLAIGYKLPFLRDFQTPRGWLTKGIAVSCCQNLRLPLS